MQNVNGRNNQGRINQHLVTQKFGSRYLFKQHKISIIPKPEFSGDFGWMGPLLNHHNLRVASAGGLVVMKFALCKKDLCPYISTHSIHGRGIFTSMETYIDPIKNQPFR